MKKILSIALLGLFVLITCLVVLKDPTKPISYRKLGFSSNSGSTFTVGTGSGMLTIDGTGNIYPSGSLILVNAGNYTGIFLKNVTGITLTNTGGVVNVGPGTGDLFDLYNVKNCLITGNGVYGIRQGFNFHDCTYKGMVLNPLCQNVKVQYCKFQTITQNGFGIVGDGKKYILGDTTTETNGIKIWYCTFDSCGQSGNSTAIFQKGSGDSITSLIRNFELFADTFRHNHSGNQVYLNLCDGYNIHGNYFKNIGMGSQQLNNDYGMIVGHGWGSFYNNYQYQCYGKMIRAWLLSIGKTPKTTYIYNNIILYNRKYSMFECQSFLGEVNMTACTYGNCEIFNNTGGNLDYDLTLSPYDGTISEIFGNPNLTYGSISPSKIRVFNNALYNVNPIPSVTLTKTSTGTQLNLINNTAAQRVDQYSNVYNATAAGIGFNESTLHLNTGSLLKNTGVKPPFPILDFFNQTRSANTPSIGAVEN